MLVTTAFDKMWDGDDGLLDDFDFTVIAPKFGYTEYNQGNTLLLLLEGEAVTSDGAVVEHTCQYSCGSKHEPVGQGEKAVHESGEDKPFNKRAGVMDLVRAARELGALDEAIAAGLTPLDASMWKGLKFHMNRIKVGDFTPEGESEKRDVVRELPTAFLGKADGGVAAPASPTSAPVQAAASTQTASAPAPSAPAASNGGSNGAVSDAQLLVLGRQSGGDYVTWLEGAEKLGVKVTDPRLDEKGEIWKAVTG